MAKSKDQLKTELEAIAEKTRDAYDILNDKGPGKNGLYVQLADAENTLKKKNAFESAKKEAKANIERLKPLIREAEVTYKKFQEQKNALNKEIKALDKAEAEKKAKAATAKGAGNVYDKALAELQKAELGIEGYKGDEKYIDAYRKAEAAFKTLTDSGATPKVALPAAKIEIPVVDTETKLDENGKPIPAKEPNITEFITLVTDPKNKKLLIDVQNDLATNFGYKGPVDGSPSTDFLSSLQYAYTQRGSLPEAWKGTDFRSFLANPNVGGTKTTAGGTAAPTSFASISSESQAAGAINQVFQTELGRDATKAEIKKLYPELIKAQAANPSKSKIVKGVRQSIAGLDTGQWLREKAQALPEFATKKAEKAGGTKEMLAGVLSANGLPMNDIQLDEWAKQVENGGDIEAIKRGIRKVAAIGQPDSIKQLMAEGTDLSTIYSPYKAEMARVLEVPISSINLDDSTLRSAIGPDREMSLYDFEKTLRQDQRWQYTDQARSEASDIATKVLRDFGFMG